MKSKIFTIIGLIIFVVIILLPPIIHHYIYPNIGDDTAVHLEVFDKMRQGSIFWGAYLGYILVGYPIIYASDIFNISIDSIFLWFNYLSLVLVGLTIFFVTSTLVNKKVGWLVLIISLFCTQSIFYQFYYGQIFNLINIGIIFPILLYFFVKYFNEKKKHQLILFIIFAILFVSFHTSGIYLPAISGFATIAYLIYGKVRKVKVDMGIVKIGFSIMVIGVIIFSIIVILPTLNTAWMMNNNWGTILVNMVKGLSVPIAHYLLDIVSPTLMILFALVIVYFKDIFKKLENYTKPLVFCLFCSLIALGLSAFAKISLDPWRQALDFATILSIFIAILVGILINRKTKILTAIVLIVICFGLYHNLPTWFGYNSSIRPVDKEVLAYINSLEYKTYSCSAEVAPWIYGRFMKDDWIEDNGDLLLVRSSPMTPRSDPDNIWYGNHGILPNNNYKLFAVFEDNKVEIDLYERINNR